MPKAEIIYFSGCPFLEKARHAVARAGYDLVTEINLDSLPSGHTYRSLSSPSVIVDEKLVIGTRNSPNSCSIFNWDTAHSILTKFIRA